MKPVLSSVKRAIAEATPDMAGDLLKNGLLLSGGSALLSGLKDWLSFELGIPVLVPDNPADIISEGCLKALDKQKHLSLLIENGEKILWRRLIVIFFDRKKIVFAILLFIFAGACGWFWRHREYIPFVSQPLSTGAAPFEYGGKPRSLEYKRWIGNPFSGSE